MSNTPSTSSGSKRPADDSFATPSTSSGSKRSFEDSFVTPSSSSSHGQPPFKRKVTSPEVQLPAPAVSPETNRKILQHQHKKLREKLAVKLKLEEDMIERKEQLQLRQTQDDDVLNAINRYWSQLNEDIKIVLRRFDETTPLCDIEASNEATTSFLTQLSTWDKEELNSQLTQRVEMSTQAVAKLIEAFQRVQERDENILKAIESPETADMGLNEALASAVAQLQKENSQLEIINKHLEQQIKIMQLKRPELEENLNEEQVKTDELKERAEDEEWKITKAILEYDKYRNRLSEVEEKNKRSQQSKGPEGPSASILMPPPKTVEQTTSDRDINNLQKENEELKEMANARLAELESLHHSHRDTVMNLEKMRMEKKNLPEATIMEAHAYKALQSKYSILFNESAQLRTSFEEARHSATQMRSQQLKHNEQMESEELLMQKKLRTEMIQLEDMLSQVRQEHESLRVEYEQNLTANEQTGPINREMRKLITSLQNHNQQLKGDAGRSRKRYKELSLDVSKLKKERDHFEAKLTSLMEKERLRRASRESETETSTGVKEEETPTSSSSDVAQQSKPLQQPTDQVEPVVDPAPPNGSPAPGSVSTTPSKPPAEKKTPEVEILPLPLVEKDIDLKAELKKTLHEQRETKLLLDMYKSSGKDPRDKAQLIAAEKKSRAELEELKQTVKKLQEARNEEKKKLADVDAVKKIRALEEQLLHLQKSDATQKAEEEAMIAEMEVTGQAFEEMSDQNNRLQNELRGKDDANFKLLSERVKIANLHKAAKEELQTLQEQVNSMSQRVEEQNVIVRKLEEKERLAVNTISAMEKEAQARLVNSEAFKFKAVETAQSAFEMSLHLDKYQKQMKDAQEILTAKTSTLEVETRKTKLLQEEILGLRKKLERLNKIEKAGNSDEILLEEIKEYKEALTCPICKVRRKDGFLSKCFHVFCFECLRLRYETRQRKCPKCNAGFGVNDFHRLYLT